MRPASADEAEAFFAQMPEQDRQMGAIGHVRIDFGMDGDEFWHTWHPRGEESLNSDAFRGDYHAYLTCFDLNVQRENLAKENAFSDRRGDSGIKSVVGSFRIMWDGFRKEMPGNPKKNR